MLVVVVLVLLVVVVELTRVLVEVVVFPVVDTLVLVSVTVVDTPGVSRNGAVAESRITVPFEASTVITYPPVGPIAVKTPRTLPPVTMQPCEDTIVPSI